MKRITLFTVLTMGLIGSSTACRQEIPYPAKTSERTITISLLSPETLTKAGETTQTEAEKAISSFDVFLFSDGTLSRHERISGTNGKIKAMSGFDYKACVVANSDKDFSSVQSEQDLLATVFNFTDNGPGNFIMVSDMQTIPSFEKDETLEFEMKRLVAKIALSGDITIDLPQDHADYGNAKVVSAFILNIPESATFSMEQGSPKMLNDGSVSVSSSGTVQNGLPMTYLNIDDGSDGKADFYCYPNSEKESEDIRENDKVTKFVICALFGDKKYYYPIGIPDIKSNHVYEISSVSITTEGSEEQNQYVIGPTLNFTVSVKDWSTGYFLGNYNSGNKVFKF